MTENDDAADPGNSSPSDAAGTPPKQASAEPSVSALIIGQATAVLAVAAAVIYAAGGLSLGLRLWYNQYSWAPVLGQLPKTFLLVDAMIVIAPAIIVGLIAYLIYDKLKGRRSRWPSGRIAPWLVSATLAAILAIAPLTLLPFVNRNTINGVIRPYWQIYIACLVLNVIFIRLCFYLLPKANVKGLETILSVGMLAFAFIPAIASVRATAKFPIVELCGPAFYHHGTYGNYALGNLIGADGRSVYVAETITHSPNIFRGGYIAVIPLSAVHLESIGSEATCGDLRPQPHQARPSASRKPHLSHTADKQR